MTPLRIKEILDSALCRRERARLAEKLAADLGVSRGTVLRKAREAGARANAKIRSDAGRSTVSLADLKLVAGTVAKTQRLNGQVVAPVSGVVEMLKANGQLPNVSTAHICRELRRAELSLREIKAPPTWRNRSTEPGQVFVLDSSGSLQWHFPDDSSPSSLSDGSNRPLAEINVATRMRLYKPEVAASLKKQIKRYFIIDHASQFAFGRYLWTRGETEFDTINVLLAAFAAMGVPRYLYIDAGPGNTAFATKYLLWLLDVTIIWKGHEEWHLGRIDNVHGQVQRGLEWRFSHARPQNLDEMNELLSAWLHKRNAVDVHRAAGRTRQDMFLDAAPGVLRRLADPGALQAAQVSRPILRRIDGRGILQFGGRLWRVDRADLFNTSQFISVNPFDPATVLVLVDFDLETLQCSGRVEAVEEQLSAFGLPMSAAPLVGEHPVSARKPEFVAAVREAKKLAAAEIAARSIDPYADLRSAQSASSFAEQQLARTLAQADAIDLGEKERSFAGATAVYRAMKLLRDAKLDLPDAYAATLAAWRERDGVRASEIESFVAAVRAAAEEPPAAAQEKSA